MSEANERRRDAYGDSQIQALKKALLFAAMIALSGIWFARKLPERMET